MDTIKIAFEIPLSALTALKQNPDQFAQELRLAAAVRWYESRIISQSKAAEIAGISRAEFIDALIRFEVSPFQHASPDELTTEYGDNPLGD